MLEIDDINGAISDTSNEGVVSSSGVKLMVLAQENCSEQWFLRCGRHGHLAITPANPQDERDGCSVEVILGCLRRDVLDSKGWISASWEGEDSKLEDGAVRGMGSCQARAQARASLECPMPMWKEGPCKREGSVACLPWGWRHRSRWPILHTDPIPTSANVYSPVQRGVSELA